MTREELFELHTQMCGTALEIMKRKNADYSKDGPLDNFYVCDAMRAASPLNGIVVRMGDKLSRVVSVAEKGAQVKDESLRDTLIDLINYAVLAAAVLQAQKDTGGTVSRKLPEGTKFCS